MKLDYRRRARDYVDEMVPERVQRVFPLVAGLVLLALGLVVNPYQLSLLTQILILGIFGMSYDLLFGYTGYLSFGHAAFFGLGTYTVVYGVNMMGLSLGVAIIVVAVGATLLALLIGIVAFRTTGVYFSMITLAFAQVMYLLTIRMGDAVGGASGLSMRSRPTTLLPLDLNEGYQFYILTIVSLLATYYLLVKLLSSPVGDVFRAIRENEERAEMVGYHVLQYKLGALVVSGIFAAFAGLLYGQFLFFASPRFLYWTTTGDVLLQTLLGGAGTLVGPIVGGAFVVLLEEFLSPITDQWFMLVGVAFVLVIIFFPDGIMGLLEDEEGEGP